MRGDSSSFSITNPYYGEGRASYEDTESTDSLNELPLDTTIREILLLSVNITLYTIVLMVFFWYVVSTQFVQILHDKIDVVREFIEEEGIQISLHANYTAAKEAAEMQYALRTEYNIGLMMAYLFPFMYGDVSLTVALYLFALFRRVRINYIPLLLVPSGFIVEVIFYFVVIRQWVVIGDIRVLYAIVEP